MHASSEYDITGVNRLPILAIALAVGSALNRLEPTDHPLAFGAITHPLDLNDDVTDCAWRTGQPFLPEFVARSQREPDRKLRDPQLWNDMWQAALDFLSINPPPRLDQQFNAQKGNAARSWLMSKWFRRAASAAPNLAHPELAVPMVPWNPS
jgi:hypothetical protein